MQSKTEQRTNKLHKNVSDPAIQLASGSLTSVSLRRLLNDRLKKGVFMKSIVMPSAVQLNEETKKQLTKEVKETLATQENETSKTFTASQMWNTHRNMRSATEMMRKWNLN